MFKSIKTKMLVSFTSAVMILLLIFIYVVMNYSRNIVEEVSYAELEEMTKSYSNEFSIEMQKNYEISRSLAGLLGHNRSGNRNEVINYLKEVLDKNPQIVGTFALYDKNQFDGSDSKFTGQTAAGSNSEGMFTPYYNRLQGSEALDALEEKDIINSDFYIQPRQKGEGVILEPYLYNNVLITSYVFPIKKDGRIVGVAGVDVTLDYIDKKVSDIKILNSGFASLVSNAGLFISDKTKENIGKVTLSQAAKKFNVPQLEEIAKGIKENRSGMVTTIDFATGNKMLLFYRPFGIAQWGMLTLAPEYEILEGVSRLSNIMIFLSIGVLILLGAAIYLLADRFSKPLLQLGNAADEVAKGNFSIQVNVAGNDEIGRMAGSFNMMVSKVKELMDETRLKGELAERAASEAETARNNAIKQEEYLAGSVEELMKKMERFSSGDMTVCVTATDNDSVGKLFNGFNKTVKTMHSTIGTVSDAIEATASSANQISSAAEEMSAGAQEQNEKTGEIAGAVEEMTRTILENSQNASLASDISKEASSSAKLGKDKVKATKEGIQKIVEASTLTASVVGSLAKKTEQIGEIARVINDIADQTNLLALNAAIEAARAGEQGRGFAVVADEVRKLAERTGSATKEIADTIKAIQTEAHDADNSMKVVKYNVEKGMSLTEEVSVALEEILEKSSRVSDVIIQLAASSEEQSAASEQISKNIEGISSVTQQTADGIHQMARAAEDLRHLTLNLQKIISQFNLAGHSLRV